MPSTPHIAHTAPIAETILLPGDPLRAKFIRENYLTDAAEFNSIRGMLGYTGKYKGAPVSVMGTGMGMPSMGIYSYELINIFGVKNLIRTGSCGALQEDIKLYDIILALAASTNSAYGSQYLLPGQYSPSASWPLIKACAAQADRLGIPVRAGNILSSDTFYDDNEDSAFQWKKMGVLGIEMETAALYMNAARGGANALSIITVSDQIISHEQTTAQQRETAFSQMIELALETALSIA
ncbi:MAG: purine-nucleoside phosphorylase [Defluviitaleaceae bacterium]|nr:purine-nucleoside phosphorylase [Defluviitaleaceae bacterium]